MADVSNGFSVDFAKELVVFNFWENRRVWDEAIMQLSDEQFTADTGYSWGTVQREVIHIMNGERGWLGRILGSAEMTERLVFEEYVDRQKIRQKWDEIQQSWDDFMGSLTVEGFFADCEFEFRGKQVKMPTWKPIFHVTNHGTLHRTEIMRMVAEVHKPMEFDLSTMQYFAGVSR